MILHEISQLNGGSSRIGVPRDVQNPQPAVLIFDVGDPFMRQEMRKYMAPDDRRNKVQACGPRVRQQQRIVHCGDDPRVDRVGRQRERRRLKFPNKVGAHVENPQSRILGEFRPSWSRCQVSRRMEGLIAHECLEDEGGGFKFTRGKGRQSAVNFFRK